MEKIIVTRHEALVAWLKQNGITGKVTPHATVENVAGNHVIGVLPLHLAAKAAVVTTVSLDVPENLRGKELSLKEIEACGPCLETFTVLNGAYAILPGGYHNEIAPIQV